MVRRLIIGVLLVLTPLSAAAQMYRCVDERGRTHYSDKAVPGCKPVAGTTQPGPAATKPGTVAGKPGSAAGKGGAAKSAPPHVALVPQKPASKPPAKPKPSAKPSAKQQPSVQAAQQPNKAQIAARCKGLQEEHDWLMSPRGEGVEARAARLAQVKQAMRACP